jgi:hypothetical protein
LEVVVVRGNLTFDHRNFVAIEQLWAAGTVFIDFVGQLLAMRDFEAEVDEKAGRPREQADAGHSVPASLIQQCLRRRAPDAAPFACGRHGDRANLGEVPAVEMQSTATDSTVVFGHYKIANVFAQLRDAARQECARVGIGLMIAWMWSTSVRTAFRLSIRDTEGNE